jgi:hypothetical protein
MGVLKRRYVTKTGAVKEYRYATVKGLPYKECRRDEWKRLFHSKSGRSARLTEAEAEQVRQLHQAGLGQADIASGWSGAGGHCKVSGNDQVPCSSLLGRAIEIAGGSVGGRILLVRNCTLQDLLGAGLDYQPDAKRENKGMDATSVSLSLVQAAKASSNTVHHSTSEGGK